MEVLGTGIHMEKNNIFYDIHFHAMTLNHPNFLAFFDNLSKNFGDTLLADIFSPRYIFDRRDSDKILSIKNMISVMENDLPHVFMLMEDDLMGKYCEDDQQNIYLQNDKFYFRNKVYDKIFLCPLIMDFDNPFVNIDNIYYTKPPVKPIIKVVDSILGGISEFYKLRPDSLFRFFPFLGINPQNYSLYEIEHLLKKYLPVFAGVSNFKDNIVDLTAKLKLKFKPIEQFSLSGIKLYPPLGFDPWPDQEGEGLEKVRFIYEYASKNNIPITVHCDDQGFRTIGLKASWKYTSPERWVPVFENYPFLKVNFAHFGMQYYRKFGIKKQWSWFEQIIEYMMVYENVYADISFDAAVDSYMFDLYQKIQKLPDFLKEKCLNRIMFGTDFPVNLSKINSYRSYFEKVDNSLFPDAEINKIVSTNCKTFLFG